MKSEKSDNKIYVDAGTTYSKIISRTDIPELSAFKCNADSLHYYICKSDELKSMNVKPDKACGHMSGIEGSENEIVALARGCSGCVAPDAVVLDLGSRDAKWIRFQDGKFHDMDWNSSCASSTGATVEMLMKFYELDTGALEFNPEKFAVTCGIFGLEKIMDDISGGEKPVAAVAKFVHGIAYNAWSFAKKPETLYLSGGFCENECFVKSLENYCKVVPLGRFKLCEGLLL